MIHFECDYVEGAHPDIMQRLLETNMEQTPGYGNDIYSRRAGERIRKAAGCPLADVHFLSGGTQTNLTVIAAVLRPWQGVLTADEGHIANHETGAIEASGHKVLTLPSRDGRITGDQIRKYYHEHHESEIHEHTVQPGMVYISFPTESGTLYTKEQLRDLSDACRECGLFLYLDGARLGYGLMSPANDVKLADIAALCDVFYIGGTKCGALFGEAVVITNENLKKDFRYMIKQRGGMLAKGRMLGIQFDVLFENGLYFDICKSAVDRALTIRQAFEKRGIQMYGSSMTNQQFPLLTDEQMDFLAGKYVYEIWGKYNENYTIVRFCTSWATCDENVSELVADIKRLQV